MKFRLGIIAGAALAGLAFASPAPAKDFTPTLTQQDGADLIDALNLWVKTNGLTVAGRADALLRKLQAGYAEANGAAIDAPKEAPPPPAEPAK